MEHAEIFGIDKFWLRPGMVVVLTRVLVSQRPATVWTLQIIVVLLSLGCILKD